MNVINTHKKAIVIALAFIIGFILFDFSSFGGSIQFYAKWIECDQKPVSLHAKPGMQWYEEPKSFEVTRFGYQEYKCTPLEAEKADYSASEYTWDQPHLEEYRQQQDE